MHAALVLEKDIEIRVPLQKVWDAWTTTQGLSSFFAKNNRFEPRVGGPFEIFFSMDAPEGKRGSEGCVVMAIEPHRMFSFSWNAPPQFPHVREQRTFVNLRFGWNGTTTHLSLRQHGWCESDEWLAVFDYFDEAWGKVLEHLKTTLEFESSRSETL